MDILVIGGTGHIGTYLVPRLVRAGHRVRVTARKPEPRYTYPQLDWPAIDWIVADRSEEERSDAWLQRMRAIETDAVIDLICYTLEQQQAMYKAFRGRVRHFLHCGTIWAYGPTEYAPYEEHHPRRPSMDYGRNKVAIEKFLHEKFRNEGFPSTVIHPGHISGRRWLPIDPQGSCGGVEVYRKLACGEPVVLPDQGPATIHHVHGDDVAQQFELAIRHREQALGESFSAVAPYAMSLLGCCRAVAGMFGREPVIRFVPLAELDEHLGKRSADIVRENVQHSPCISTAKAQRLLGHTPRYTTEEIYAECLDHMLEKGKLHI